MSHKDKDPTASIGENLMRIAAAAAVGAVIFKLANHMLGGELADAMGSFANEVLAQPDVY
jgi:hypothetical protein